MAANYARRSHSETAMFHYQAVIGNNLRARTLPVKNTEAKADRSLLELYDQGWHARGSAGPLKPLCWVSAAQSELCTKVLAGDRQDAQALAVVKSRR